MKKPSATHPKRRTAASADDPSTLWAQAVEHSTDLMAMVDLDGRVLMANQAFLDVLGRDRTDVIGQNISIALAPANPPALLQELTEKSRQETGWKGECLFARGDGTPLPVLLSVGPVRDRKGRLIGTFGIAQNIEERRRTEEALRERDELFRQLTENIEEVLFMVEPSPPRIVYVSQSYERIWGRSRQLLYERSTEWIDAVHTEDRERMARAFGQSLLGVPVQNEFRIVRPDGAVRWIHGRTFPVQDAHGALTRVVGLAADVTSRRHEEAALREAHAKLDRALQASERLTQEAARLTELVDILQSCHDVEEAYRITGTCLPRILAAESGALCITSPSRDTLQAEATWGESMATAQAFAPDQCWALRRGTAHLVNDPDSPLRCAHMIGSPRRPYVCIPLAAQGETLGVLSLEGPRSHEPAGRSPDQVLVDLSRQAVAVGERISLALANLRLREVLRRQSIRDPLTGLFNRRYMEESLDRELQRAARNGQQVALLMLDVDHFKQFNDTSGHHAGDTLLRALGGLLLEQTRGEDVACRFGGEEFVVILSNTGIDDAVHRAEVMREGVARLVVPHAGQVLGRITASVGIAVFPHHGEKSETLLKVADSALYRAKTEGRDRVAVGG